MFKVLILILVLATYVISWDIPYDLLISNNNFYIKDLFTDPTTEIHHLLFIDRNRISLHYWQIGAKNAILLKKVFTDSAFKIEIELARIKAERNSIYLIITAYRIGGFYDIWYTESKDAGKTWTAFIQLPRDSLYDSCHRETDNMIYITDTQRLTIVYNVYCPPNKGKLALVTKPPGSSIFTKEKIIYENSLYNLYRPSINAGYTLDNHDNSIIHAFFGAYNREDKSIFYIFSKDNGITWSNAKKISGNDLYANYLMLNIATMEKSLAGSYAVNPSDKLRMFFGDSNGEKIEVWNNGTIENQTVFPNWDYRVNGIAICGNKENSKVFMVSQTNAFNMEYSITNLNNKEIQRNDPPFKDFEGKRFGIRLTCRNVPKEKKIYVTAITTIEDKEEKTHLLKTENNIEY